MRAGVTFVAALACAAFLSAALPSRAGAAPIPWCGTPTAEDRFPDAVSAFHWRVIYAAPRDARDRFTEMAPHIVGDVAAITSWWRREDSSRAPRFDLYDFPGCPTEAARVDLARVVLPQAAGAYAATSLNGILRDLPRTPFADDKYLLVYYDGALADPRICGVGRTGIAIVLLGACGNDFDTEGRPAVAAHEMLHGLGAVPRPVNGQGPPHPCPGDPGHVCDSPGDLMGQYKVGGLTALALDVGRDDYYGHGRPWWDIQRDSLLLHRFDVRDQAPPSAPAVTATSIGTSALFSWPRSTDDVGPVRYRLYDAAGELQDNLTGPSFSVEAEIGRVLVYNVRAWDAVGFLSAPATIRFRVGYGIVDEAGALVRDTVAPGAVTRLRARTRGRQIVLSWRAAVDLGGLRGYEVRVAGRRLKVVRGTSTTVPRARGAGRRIEVAAVDRGGNVGRAAVVRGPRR